MSLFLSEYLNSANSIAQGIQSIMEHNSLFLGLVIYSAILSVFIIALLIRSRRKKHKYVMWKKDTINLWVFKREYEVIQDEFMMQLWDENKRLEQELAFLNKDHKKMKFTYIFTVAVLFAIMWLKGVFSEKTTSEKNTKPDLDEDKKLQSDKIKSMNWIYQKEGLIDHYNTRVHLGTQPVRVINQMLVYMFQQTYPDFASELIEQIEKDNLNKELKFVFEEVPIVISAGYLRTPRINIATKQIELHETFLSFLWASTYAVFVTYVETVDYPKLNQQEGRAKYPISQHDIDKAKELFNYGKYLIIDFQPWDKIALPNPETYLAEKRDYVEQTNLFYTEAVKFILCHEFTHLKMHVHQIDEWTDDVNFLNFEVEADNNAIDLMKKGMIHEETPIATARNLAIENGVIFGILSMFFFSARTKGVKHPNAEDRLSNALERLALDDNAYAWGIACVGLQFWDEQFGLNFKWEDQIISYRNQYYSIVAQIKER